MSHMTEQPSVRIPQWTLADRLRKAREASGLTQAGIAEQLGISRASVVAYETGRTVPSRPVLLSWALVCAVPWTWLATGESGAPTPTPGAPLSVTGKADCLSSTAA